MSEISRTDCTASLRVRLLRQAERLLVLQIVRHRQRDEDQRLPLDVRDDHIFNKVDCLRFGVLYQSYLDDRKKTHMQARKGDSPGRSMNDRSVRSGPEMSTTTVFREKRSCLGSWFLRNVSVSAMSRKTPGSTWGLSTAAVARRRARHHGVQ
jgi:hypothetical protein